MKSEWSNGINLKCENCKRRIGELAPGTYGWVSLRCPWCGHISNKERPYIPWSQVWKK